MGRRQNRPWRRERLPTALGMVNRRGDYLRTTNDPRQRRRGSLYTAVVPRMVIWLLLATASGGGLTAAQADDLVDSRVCASCHPTAARNYLQTGMGRSFFRPTPANTIEDYTVSNEF